MEKFEISSKHYIIWLDIPELLCVTMGDNCLISPYYHTYMIASCSTRDDMRGYFMYIETVSDVPTTRHEKSLSATQKTRKEEITGTSIKENLEELLEYLGKYEKEVTHIDQTQNNCAKLESILTESLSGIKKILSSPKSLILKTVKKVNGDNYMCLKMRRLHLRNNILKIPQHKLMRERLGKSTIKSNKTMIIFNSPKYAASFGHSVLSKETLFHRSLADERDSQLQPCCLPPYRYHQAHASPFSSVSYVVTSGEHDPVGTINSTRGKEVLSLCFLVPPFSSAKSSSRIRRINLRSPNVRVGKSSLTSLGLKALHVAGQTQQKRKYLALLPVKGSVSMSYSEVFIVARFTSLYTIRAHNENSERSETDSKSDQDESKPGQSMKSRSFSEAWLSKFPWLIYEDCAMKCDICVKTHQSNPFVTGCKNFRTSTLTRHESSKSHTTALKNLQLQIHFKKCVENAEKVAENYQNSDGQTKRHIVQLKTVYCMAKCGISARNFGNSMQLQQENGCKFADDYFVKPETVTEMETVLGDQIEKDLICDILDCPYIGIMLDETCDITVEKKLVVYIRYIKNGEATVSYLGNKKVTDCTAGCLKVALFEFLESKDVIKNNDYSSLMWLGTDGASVMVGCRNGLGVKMKTEYNNKLVQVHCVAHRLNLAASQVSTGIPYMEDYKRYIQLLYKFYSDSSVRYDKLRELQTLLHGKVKQVPEGTSVRWLSVESAVKMISITALPIDILTVIGILSLTFQQDIVNLSSIRRNVDATVSTLRTMVQHSDTVEQVLQDQHSDTVEQVLQELGAQRADQLYHNIKIQENQNLRERFNCVRRRYLDQLIENMNTRFPNDDLNLLQCFDKLFNPRRFPNTQLNVAAHGFEHLNKLCEFYQDVIDVNRCKGQF
ncbi:hypothetical protein KUTeg_019677 [Tegillarca granosa]|uniref:TTF-type domain-containing protein n=1 Tax=Tegillarca granosa TaxID=220873 RepID=A0ABQ9EHF0_TEGGR|nr:hypothetical protein KUTeg_019677 [Tegillarca granosa]